MMKKVFICSPLATTAVGEEEKKKELLANLEVAKKASLYAITTLALPYTPHLYFTQLLDDEVESERELGMELGIEWLKECDELWVIGRRISEGMRNEIELAEALEIPVKHYVFKRTREERIADALYYPEISFLEMV